MYLSSQVLQKTDVVSANSLEKEPGRRASPWRMLEHPWMVEMKTKRVNMQRYLSQVWGWDEAKKEAA